MRVSTSPAQGCRRRFKPSRRVDDVAGELQSSKGPALQDIFFGSQENHSTKAQGLANSLSKKLTFHNTLKSVLKTKDMNTKLLDVLEMFFNVYEVSQVSSKLQMVGGAHIYRPHT